MLDHLGLNSTAAKVSIITGDPDRVPAIAAAFEGASELTSRRGLLCYQAMTGDVPLLITASGIGAPSTAIVVEELIDLGITLVLRLGTCGAIQHHIRPGDLVIPTGCIREEGTSLQYVDRAFPAVPDPFVLQSLMQGAKGIEARSYFGVTHCKDAYYSEKPDKQIDPESTRQRWQIWRRAGALATEMETSALFVLGSLRGVRTGAVFVNVGSSQDQTEFNSSLMKAVSLLQMAIRSVSEQKLIPERAIASGGSGKSFLDRPRD